MAKTETSFSIAAFVRELGLAWQKLSMYQEGHPERQEVTARVHRILVGLVAPTGSIALGIDKTAILGAEERIEGGAAAKLADALYHRNVAILRFDEGVSVRELETFLTTLPRRRVTEDEEALWDQLEALAVTRVRLDPSDFSGVIAKEDGRDADEEGERGVVWETILRRLLNDEGLGPHVARVVPEGGGGSFRDLLEVVQRVIERHGLSPCEPGAGRVSAPDSALEALGPLGRIVGSGLTEGLLKTPDQAARSGAARHIAELLSALPEELRETVLDSSLAALSADDEKASAFQDLSSSLSAAELVASLRRLRDEKISFSTRMTGLVEDLVAQNAAVLTSSDPLGDGEALTEGLRKVFGGEDVDRVAPSQRRIDRVAMELRRSPSREVDPEELEPRLNSLTEHQLILKLAQTLLSLLQRPFFNDEQVGSIATRMELVIQSLLTSGRLVNAVRVVRAVRAIAGDAERKPAVQNAAKRCLDRLGKQDTISALTEALAGLEEDSIPMVHELLELLGDQVIPELLLALSEETDLGRRRKTFNLLVSLGSQVAPHAGALVDDERWYVTRNMLSLLRQVGDPIPLDLVRSGLLNPDARVKLEAVKCLSFVPEKIPPEMIRKGLEDPDPKVVEAVVNAIGTLGLAGAQPALLEILKKADPLARNSALRIKVLGVLGRLGRSEALEEISHFFKGWFATVTPDERRAAYASLEGYPEEARRPWVNKGLRSTDKEIREICQRLSARKGR